jgi:uncharacterized protein YndB with AHSA1/START domain
MFGKDAAVTTATDPTKSAEDFQRTGTFTSSADAVHEAVCTTAGIEGWWGSTIGSAGEGGTFEVGFGSDRLIVMEAVSVDARRVEWKVERAPHTPEWDGTTIVFELEPAETGTELRFRHHGLSPQLECFDMCNEGWTHYLASLVDYVDHGAGHPYRHGRDRSHEDGES